MHLGAQIEAVLFYKAEPVKKSVLADFFDVSEAEVEEALSGLYAALSERGVRVIITDTHAQLVTAPEIGEIIESMRKAELKQDIGKAGAETLAIILYRGPLSRSEVDRIRGVNSAFIVRNLLIRGLVERRANPRDTRSSMYAATPALLAHLGVARKEDLPDFAVIMNSLDAFMKDEPEQAPITEHE